MRYLTAMLGSLLMLNGNAATAERRASPQVTTLTVMTLNAAHGRGTSIHQSFVPDGRHRENLDQIVSLMQREKPAIVALQEVDGVCNWSGDFDHVDYLRNAADYRDAIRVDLVSRPGRQHGVALIGAMPFEEVDEVRFRKATVATPKGFVVSTVDWPGEKQLEVDVVSVHLEAFRPGLRRRQVEAMIEYLEKRERPMIVMGDMNTDWEGRHRVLQKLVTELGLRAFEPGNRRHVSLPSLGRRLDWILISEPLQFVRYDTLPESVSDHRAVVAEIALAH
ncbi:MAG: hypothetical protein HKN49_01075 [Gammaproteobacteria bacterium]|nr:hypothetical protein [Gammaproteobacteria bacterium]